MEWKKGEMVPRGTQGQYKSRVYLTDEGYRAGPTPGGRYKGYAPDGTCLSKAEGNLEMAKLDCEDHWRANRPVEEFVVNVPAVTPRPDGRHDPVPAMTDHAPLPGSDGTNWSTGSGTFNHDPADGRQVPPDRDAQE